MARHFRGFPSSPLIRPFRLLNNAFYDTVAESGTAADTLTNAAVFANALSESGSASDSNSAAAVFASSIAESGSASDSVTGGLLLSDSVSESLSASDTSSAVAVFASTNSESGSASDSSSAAAVFASSQSESASASDTDTSIATYGVSQDESGSASDSDSAAAIFGSINSEAAIASENGSASAVFGSIDDETASAADTTDGTVVGGGTTYDDTVSETGSAVDSVSADLIHLGGPAIPYPRKRRRPGRGRSLQDICDEIEREMAEPVIKLAPDLDQFAGEYFGRQIDELETAVAEFAAERRDIESYRDDVIHAHAQALLRRLRDEEEMCALLLLSQ